MRNRLGLACLNGTTSDVDCRKQSCSMGGFVFQSSCMASDGSPQLTEVPCP